MEDYDDADFGDDVDFGDDGDETNGRELVTKNDIVAFTRDVLQRYFPPGRQFGLERMLGSGNDGVTYLIVEKAPVPPPPDDIQRGDRKRSRSPEQDHNPLPQKTPSNANHLEGVDDIDLLNLAVPAPGQVRPPLPPAPIRQYRDRVDRPSPNRPPAYTNVVVRRILLKIDKIALARRYYPDQVSSSSDDDDDDDANGDGANSAEKEKRFLEVPSLNIE
ncbi:hypothetical protein F5Y12DRAFT_711520 [Xylaria sp. FL1777]|nr:hypothetical protein F5Y12DRAFT_711520 [Xylaria sp. FL1777]